MRWFTILLVGLVGCSKQESQPAPTATSPTRAVEVLRLTGTKLETRLRLPGELAAFEAVDIQARVSGVIGSIAVDRGAHVRRGDVLLRIDAPELSAQRAEAEAKSKANAGTYARLQEASATAGAVAQHEVDLAQAALQADEARVLGLRALESFTVIRAPFDGVITQRNVHPGAFVSPGGAVPLLRIEAVARLRLTVPVPQHAVAALPIGSAVPFRVMAWPGVAFTGKVARAANTLDPRTRTMSVEMDVDNGDGRLAAGSYADVDWPVIRSQPTLMVPRTAIVQTASRAFVVRVDDGKATRIDVQRGLTRGDDVEVFGALNEGDWVVRKASDDIVDGAALVVREPTKQP